MEKLQEQHINITKMSPLSQDFNENEFIGLSSCDLGDAGCQGDITISVLVRVSMLANHLKPQSPLLNTSLFIATSSAYVIRADGGGAPTNLQI